MESNVRINLPIMPLIITRLLNPNYARNLNHLYRKQDSLILEIDINLRDNNDNRILKIVTFIIYKLILEPPH